MPLLPVGAAAPEFRVPDHTGRERTLGEFRGKRVVLYFYPKADTPGCTAESCGFRDHAPEYSTKNAQILGVSFDTVAENAAFVKKYGLPFPLLCDTSRSIGLSYGATSDPKAKHADRITYVIGPDGKVEQAHAKVDAKSHPATLLGSL
jgi:peroxiredoxin Q/BCP